MKECGVAVVVTYNRVDKLKICLDCLLKQTYELTNIYVVNNASTDNTESFLKEYCQMHTQIKFVTTMENTGGSGGFYTAIKWAYEDGADWIWGMDDDAFPNNNALEEIIKQRKFLEKNGIANCYWSNCDCDQEFKEDVKKVNAWMFVGFFLPRVIIDNVGYCRNDFFIYFDDLEYANRIISKGYNIFKIQKSVINHKDAASNIKTLKFGTYKIRVALLPSENWKAYYFIRNNILMCGDEKKKKNKRIRSGIKYLIKSAIWNPKQVKYVWIGLIDGIKKKSGKMFVP